MKNRRFSGLFVAQPGLQDANKRWTWPVWQMQVHPTQCVAADEGIFGGVAT
jgi:hypothetical protein